MRPFRFLSWLATFELARARLGEEDGDSSDDKIPLSDTKRIGELIGDIFNKDFETPEPDLSVVADQHEDRDSSSYQQERSVDGSSFDRAGGPPRRKQHVGVDSQGPSSAKNMRASDEEESSDLHAEDEDDRRGRKKRYEKSSSVSVRGGADEESGETTRRISVSAEAQTVPERTVPQNAVGEPSSSEGQEVHEHPERTRETRRSTKEKGERGGPRRHEGNEEDHEGHEEHEEDHAGTRGTRGNEEVHEREGATRRSTKATKEKEARGERGGPRTRGTRRTDSAEPARHEEDSSARASARRAPSHDGPSHDVDPHEDAAPHEDGDEAADRTSSREPEVAPVPAASMQELQQLQRTKAVAGDNGKGGQPNVQMQNAAAAAAMPKVNYLFLVNDRIEQVEIWNRYFTSADGPTLMASPYQVYMHCRQPTCITLGVK